MSASPNPNNFDSPKGEIWSENDPPLVMTAEPHAGEKSTEKEAVEPMNDPVLTLREARV